MPVARNTAAAPASADTPMKLGKPAHLWQLDVLRAAAILMVFWFHLLLLAYHGDLAAVGVETDAKWALPQSSAPSAWVFFPLSFGHFGVTLFFVISGFCIHNSYLGSLQRQQSPLHPPREPFTFGGFMWRRAWRIYPAYLAALAIFVAMQLAREHRLSPAGVWQSKSNLLAHLLMAHNLFAHPGGKDYFYSYNASFWSLGVEWQFYLMYPLFLWLRKRGGMKLAIGFAAGLSVVSRTAIEIGGLADADRCADWVFWLNFPLVTWLDWCWGALVAECWHARRPLTRIRGRWIALMWIAQVAASVYQPATPLTASFWALLFAITLDAYIRRPGKPSRVAKCLIPIGVCSYSLYLLHQPLLGEFVSILHGRLGLPKIPAIDLTLIGLTLALLLTAISYASFKIIEMPAVKTGGMLWKRISPQRMELASAPAD